MTHASGGEVEFSNAYNWEISSVRSLRLMRQATGGRRGAAVKQSGDEELIAIVTKSADETSVQGFDEEQG